KLQFGGQPKMTFHLIPRWLAGTALAMAISMLPTPSDARISFRDGNELYADCASSDAARRGLCLGYVPGVIDFTAGTERADGTGYFDYRQFAPWCLPARMLPDIKGRTLTGVPEEIRSAVELWLRDNPGKRFYAADWAVAEALRSAWPCER